MGGVPSSVKDMPDLPVTVVGAAIVAAGRVLAARRTRPAGWEFPGGKVEPGETAGQAVAREIREELGCTVRVGGWLPGSVSIGAGFELTVATCGLVGGEPVPTEHEAVRWLGPEELDDVDWLPADRPFLDPLRELLLDGEPLAGGNVGGAVRIGGTVRRPTGPWTPAVHRLLGRLAEQDVPAVPRVLGIDARGREVLTYLPGRVVDVDTELLTEAQLVALAGWARRLHDAVAGFDDPGPWRFFELSTGGAAPQDRLVGHNDLAPYNCCFLGDRLVGVFDWDMAGPSTRVFELAHLAWNAVPLFRPVDDRQAAHRLRLIATSYGGPGAREILEAVVPLKRVGIAGIRAWIAAGDPAGVAQQAIGEPESTEAALADLRMRLPRIMHLLELPS